MGQRVMEFSQEPSVWKHVEIDLMGPFLCRGEKNPRVTLKKWAMVIEDVYSGAVHCDVVDDYSAAAVIASLRKFAALRGWPTVISSDPGSQLVSAGGKLESWYQEMGKSLQGLASLKGFRWEISPANSPWRQGKTKRRIGVIKRLLKISVNDEKLTSFELQLFLFEAANITNSRPISAAKRIPADGSYTILTPNDLLLGRAIGNPA